MKKTLTIAALLIGTSLLAQVGIKTQNPNPDSDLTLASQDKGLLLNRVELEETTDAAPLNAHVEGMMVYNTATAGDVTPGQYYNDGTKWVRVGDGIVTQTDDWHVDGNAGTTAGTDFLGTTDNVDMVFKRNNVLSGSLRTNNTSFGVGSLPLTTTGIGNVAFGDNTLPSNTTASYNVAIGSSSSAINTTGFSNVGVGSFTFLNNTTGFQSVAIGVNAARFNTTGFNNTSVGYLALRNNTVGTGNTGVGHSSLTTATGNNNTAIGLSSGSNITTGSNNTAIGNGANVPNGTADNQIRIGNTAVTYAGVQVAWTVTSDKRLKSNIKDSDLGLDFINQLRPVSYIRKNDESKKSEYGFIAQEVKETLKNNGVTNSGIISEADDSTMSVRYNDLIAPMVKALQEQQKLIEELQKRIEQLENK